MREINLSELTGGGEVRNLSGHERGLAARAKFGMDNCDRATETVKIIVPSQIYTVAPSFFQGMFSNSVHHFGNRAAFFDHYSFDASPVVLRQVGRGVDALLTRRAEVEAA